MIQIRQVRCCSNDCVTNNFVSSPIEIQSKHASDRARLIPPVLINTSVREMSILTDVDQDFDIIRRKRAVPISSPSETQNGNKVKKNLHLK